MQAYARTELAPAEPEFNHPEANSDREPDPGVTAGTQLGSRRSPSVLAAALLDELNGIGLEMLAKRLAPHLDRLEARAPAVPHVANTVNSLAAELDVLPKVIRSAIARGELRGVRRGSRWIISADAVSEWAAPSMPRRTTTRNCSPRAPKAAGPSLRAVLCTGDLRGGLR